MAIDVLEARANARKVGFAVNGLPADSQVGFASGSCFHATMDVFIEVNDAVDCVEVLGAAKVLDSIDELVTGCVANCFGSYLDTSNYILLRLPVDPNDTSRVPGDMIASVFHTGTDGFRRIGDGVLQ